MVTSRISSKATTRTEMHQQMAGALDSIVAEIRRIQADARSDGFRQRPCLADDRAAHAQGLDRAQGGRRPADRRHRGARTRSRSPICRRAEAPADAGSVAEELPPGGTVRRRPARLVAEVAALAPKGDRRMGANPHRQWRPAPARPRTARFPRLCGRRAHTRRRRRRKPPASTGTVPARRAARLNAPSAQLPRVRSGRNGVESAGGGVRGHRSHLHAARFSRATNICRRTAASWKSSASISARAGWRAICSPAGTASSPATRPSSTSSIRCSTSMPSG